MAALKATSKRKDPSVEYSVYIFHRPFHQNDNHVTWEKRHTTSNIQSAYRQAENLYKSREYERVEIKKKFFDRKNDRKIDKTLKIYKETPDRPVGMWALKLSVISGVCAVVGLFLLYFKALF